MIKQVVVRTYPQGWTNETTRLQALLNAIMIAFRKTMGEENGK